MGNSLQRVEAETRLATLQSPTSRGHIELSPHRLKTKHSLCTFLHQEHDLFTPNFGGVIDIIMDYIEPFVFEVCIT